LNSEAHKRIRIAQETGAGTLDLSGCKQIGDVSPLAALTSLQSLDLSGCEQIGDVSPLAALTSLQSLNLSRCEGIRLFGPIEVLLSTLNEIRIFGCPFDDVPAELCGENEHQNVLSGLQAHYRDLRAGAVPNAEIKILVLGNGGAGKSQICRRLRGENYDPSVLTTHGIQLSETSLDIEGFENGIRLNLWDFGGQEVYHGSHALFLQGQSVMLVLWTVEREDQKPYREKGLLVRHRPLPYWLDYLRAFAGVENPVLLIQSQCDTAAERVNRLPAEVKIDDFTAMQTLQVSARTGLGLDVLNGAQGCRARAGRTPPGAAHRKRPCGSSEKAA
jgi:internalin A